MPEELTPLQEAARLLSLLHSAFPGHFRNVSVFFEKNPGLRNFPTVAEADSLRKKMDLLLEQEDDMEDAFGPSSGDSFLRKAEEIRDRLRVCGFDV